MESLHSRTKKKRTAKCSLGSIQFKLVYSPQSSKEDIPVQSQMPTIQIPMISLSKSNAELFNPSP